MKALRILHLEDDPLDTELVQAFLAEGGLECEIFRVHTRAGFVATLKSDNIDLVLADYSLPAFDGLSALKVAHEICPEVPFILVSGTLGEERAIEALKSGATDYVLKHRLERLVPAVQRAVSEAEERIERKRAEEALKESEERFRSTFEQAAVGIAHTDLDGKWLRVNRKLCEIVGYPPEELLELSFQDVTYPEDLKTDLEYTRKLLAGEIGTYCIEKRYFKKDGSLIWINLTVSLVRDSGGEPKYFIAVLEDITERKRAEEKLAEHERQLKDLVGKLVTAQEEERRRVAYEIHDGLTQVAIAAHQHLQAFANARSDDGLVELDLALDLARKTVNEARRVIEGLRPTALDDFGLAIALEQQIDQLKESEGCQIGYEADLGKERLSSEVETALFRVAQEALTNVRKHARTTKVHVKVERLGSGKVRLEVSDEGRGFDPKTAPKGGGPGERVGLSSMRERVELLGGEFEIKSQPGAGTTVIVEVPLSVSVDVRTGSRAR